MAGSLHSSRWGSTRVLAVGSLVLAAVIGLVLWSPWSRQGVSRPQAGSGETGAGEADAPGEELLLYCAAGIAEPVEAIIADYQPRIRCRRPSRSRQFRRL